MTKWDLISFVKASEIRYSMMVILKNNVRTPTELKQEFKVPMSRISSVLKELIEKDLIKNLTPERRKSKLYTLTDKGKGVLRDIERIERG